MRGAIFAQTTIEMKNKNLLMVLLMGASLCTYGQNGAAESATPKSEMEALDKRVWALEQGNPAIGMAKEEEVIGEFELYDLTPSLYRWEKFPNCKAKKSQRKSDRAKKKDADQNSEMWLEKADPIHNPNPFVGKIRVLEDAILITKVHFNIDEGSIENIRIEADSKDSTVHYVFESSTPIPLVGFDHYCLETRIENVRNEGEFLLLNDFVYFKPLPGQSYVPDDATFILKNEHEKADVKISVDLNSNLDIKVYSDALALLGRADNGLVQTEASTKISINPVVRRITPMSSLEFGLKFSKFDSQNRFVNFRDNAEPLVTSTREQLKMNQLSFLNLFCKVTLLRNKLLQNSFDFNVGLQYDFVDVNWLLSSGPTTANMFSSFIEYKGTFAKSKYLGLDVSLKIINQVLLYTEADFLFPSPEFYYSPEFTAYFKPKGDPSNRIFLRFRSFSNNWFESFSTVQIGYGAKLNYKRLK